MRYSLLFCFSFLVTVSFSQNSFQNKTGIYSFKTTAKFTQQASANERNECIFTDREDTTSLVVNVNDRATTAAEIAAFKKASNSEVEDSYFKVLKEPKIVSRGELSTYPGKTVFFHVQHAANSEKGNKFMMSYIFYHKGKAINFIFRTKERRLAVVQAEIDSIVNSVILL